MPNATVIYIDWSLTLDFVLWVYHRVFKKALCEEGLLASCVLCNPVASEPHKLNTSKKFTSINKESIVIVLWLLGRIQSIPVIVS